MQKLTSVRVRGSRGEPGKSQDSHARRFARTPIRHRIRVRTESHCQTKICRERRGAPRVAALSARPFRRQVTVHGQPPLQGLAEPLRGRAAAELAALCGGNEYNFVHAGLVGKSAGQPSIEF